MHFVVRLIELVFVSALIIYFLAKKLFREGLSAFYLLASMVLVLILVSLRLIASLVAVSIGIQIFRISLSVMPFVALFAMMFIELLAIGRNRLFPHVPLYLILGAFLVRVWEIKVNVIDSGFERSFDYRMPLELILYYTLVDFLYVIYAFYLLWRIRKRFGRGLLSGFPILITISTITMLMFNVFIVVDTIFNIGVVNERYVFAITGFTMTITLILIIVLYPRVLNLAPIKLLSVQLLEKKSNLELYSMTFYGSFENVQLVNQFISAMNLFSKEALHGGYVKSIEMENAYMFFEASEHFIAVAMAEEYHYNVRVILRNILIYAESLVGERKDLKAQLLSGVIDVDSWKKALDDVVNREVFSF